MQYAIFAFLIFFLLVSSGLSLLFYREKLSQRLAGIIGSGRAVKVEGPRKVEQFNDSIRVFAGALQKAVPKGEKEVSVVQKRLILAGYRQEAHLQLFYASKAFVPMLLCVLAAVTGAYTWQPFVIFAGAIVLGYLIPDYWLGHRITARQNAISSGLPDALDLLVVCLEAGLSLDQSVLRTGDELEFSQPALADEINLVMLEVKAGRSRADAWRGLMERTDLDGIRMLVSILLQADQFGTGVSKTLRVHADTMRKRRTQRVEELAAKTSVKLVFPLVLFIFPSLFVVMLGSAIIQISAAFANLK
jgi:tight adherence protein C